MDNVSEACNCWNQRPEETRLWLWTPKKELIQSPYFLGVTTQEPVSTRALNCTHKCFSVVLMQVHIQHLILTVKSVRTYFLLFFFRGRTTLVIRWHHQIGLFLECEQLKYFWMNVNINTKVHLTGLLSVWQLWQLHVLRFTWVIDYNDLLSFITVNI